MEHNRCRSGNRRRAAGRSGFTMFPHQLLSPWFQSSNSWIDVSFNYLLLAGVVAALYFILEFHCTHCGTRYDLNNVTTTLEYISNNLTLMKSSYQDLENQVIRVSRELPKMEGQIEVLETLASTMENGDYIWDPNQKAGLPYIEIIKQQQLKHQEILHDNIDNKRETH